MTYRTEAIFDASITV